MDEESRNILAELLVQLANGNILVLAEISRLIESLLMAIGNSYYRNRADVEDRIHDLYLKLREKACLFKVNKNAAAWIVMIYKNMIKSHLRTVQREVQWSDENMSNYGVVDE